MSFPYGPVFWTALAAGTVFRFFYHPYRSVVKDGHALKCAGAPNCDPAMVIQNYGGTVYSNASGKVIAVGLNWIQIASQHEPVILVYEGDPSMQVQVGLGESVGIGQQIALSAQLRFSVFQVFHAQGGQLTVGAVEPSGWLAARGQRISNKSHAATIWCEGGRTIEAPGAVANCGLKLPTPNGFMLLPVSVTSQ